MLTKLRLLAFVIHSKSKFLSHHLLPHRLCNSKKLEYNRELWSEPGQTNTGSGIPSSNITAMLNLYPINSTCWIAMQEKIVKWFIYSQISCENLDLTRKHVKGPLGKNKILQNIISSNCFFTCNASNNPDHEGSSIQKKKPHFYEYDIQYGKK